MLLFVVCSRFVVLVPRVFFCPRPLVLSLVEANRVWFFSVNRNKERRRRNDKEKEKNSTNQPTNHINKYEKTTIKTDINQDEGEENKEQPTRRREDTHHDNKAHHSYQHTIVSAAVPHWERDMSHATAASATHTR